MTEKTVQTIAGPFDRKRMEALRETLAQADGEMLGREEVIKFEGNDLVISFGKYLLEYLDGEFAKKGHQGL